MGQNRTMRASAPIPGCTEARAMLLIPCPHCGPRDESEFTYGGPAVACRPEAPQALSDEAWVEYLTVVPNPTRIPFSTNVLARLAAANLARSMGDRSADMGEAPK